MEHMTINRAITLYITAHYGNFTIVDRINVRALMKYLEEKSSWTEVRDDFKEFKKHTTYWRLFNILPIEKKCHKNGYEFAEAMYALLDDLVKGEEEGKEKSLDFGPHQFVKEILEVGIEFSPGNLYHG